MAMKMTNNEVEGSSLLHHTAHIIRTMNLLDMNFILRIDYCGFGPSSSTTSNLKIFISLLKVLICIMH